MPDWMLIPGQWFACLVFHSFASFCWQIDDLLLAGAVLIHYFRHWLQNDIFDLAVNLLFQPGDGNFILPYIGGALALAVLLAAAFLFLRTLGLRHSPVDPR